MKKGNTVVQQVTKEGQILEDYDISLSPKEIKEQLQKCFPGLQVGQKAPLIYFGTYQGHRYAVRCKNITYLGNPHPTYKKRIQIADDLYEFNKIATKLNAKPMLLGIYCYQDNVIFVDFKIDTYLTKKAHNSSAHIYVSDLAEASEHGYFQKIDFFGNQVTAFRPDAVTVFLDEFFKTKIEYTYTGEDELFGQVIAPAPEFGYITGTRVEKGQAYQNLLQEKIVPEVKNFFTKEEKRWHGIECYTKMIAANYKNKFQPEWAGFFLEFEFESFLKNNELENIITYYQDKTSGGIDLDLYFPELDSYGDLKAHSEESRGIQGNDWNTVISIIDKKAPNSHIYYIVCEHATEKDSEHDYEVTHFWNKQQKKPDLMSYHKRMKNNVTLKKAYILDINYSNKEYLTMFKQGINSNGKPRPPKIMIEQDNLKYFLIEEIELS